jgi:hypothetical protein
MNAMTWHDSGFFWRVAELQMRGVLVSHSYQMDERFVAAFFLRWGCDSWTDVGCG